MAFFCSFFLFLSDFQKLAFFSHFMPFCDFFLVLVFSGILFYFSARCFLFFGQFLLVFFVTFRFPKTRIFFRFSRIFFWRFFDFFFFFVVHFPIFNKVFLIHLKGRNGHKEGGVVVFFIPILHVQSSVLSPMVQWYSGRHFFLCVFFWRLQKLAFQILAFFSFSSK